MTERSFVLGLAGVPGAGKTTLTRRLLQGRHRAEVVYYDDYQDITRMSAAQVNDWFARGGDPNEFALAELIGELQRRIANGSDGGHRRLLVFETPFGRLHRMTGALIDFLVWIDTPFDAALSRALLAFVEQAQRDRAPVAVVEFLKWQRQYLINYPLVRAMYLKQRESIMPTADLVLDGIKSVETSVEIISTSLAARGVET